MLFWFTLCSLLHCIGWHVLVSFDTVLYEALKTAETFHDSENNTRLSKHRYFFCLSFCMIFHTSLSTAYLLVTMWKHRNILYLTSDILRVSDQNGVSLLYIKVSWASLWWPVAVSGAGLHNPVPTLNHVSVVSHRWISPYSYIHRSIRVECVSFLSRNRKWCTVKVSWASMWWPVTFSGVGLHKPLCTPNHVSAINHWWNLHAYILRESGLSVSVFSAETENGVRWWSVA